MSDHFPPQVIVKILKRCQVPTILRCRCVSKQWRAMIDEPDFIKQHIDYPSGANTNFSLYIKESWLCKPNLSYRQMMLHHGFLVGSCNGLVCLLQRTYSAVIINPSTQEQMFISGTLPIFFFEQDDEVFKCDYYGEMTGYGFGYDNVTNDYKIVGIVETSAIVRLVIYLVKKRETKVFEIPYLIDNKTYYYNYFMGVHTGGALHWVVCRFDDSTRKKRVILAYDVGTDELRELPQPDYSASDCYINISLLGTWLCLCANYGNQGLDFDVWVMKEYGVKESWTKLFSIPFATFMNLGIREMRPLGYSENGSQILLELYVSYSKIRLVWYDIEEKRVGETQREGKFESIVYLRSSNRLSSMIR
ncbi:F-box protein CPR1-like [Mercurialis annua]|uniref:F-box protein CPR1-like n=1 Tax=Mercurialis annua TaxID=3986 RepID=UPI00215FA0FD|nr:F-box protein CPR1-like [Mercurialis annua]